MSRTDKDAPAWVRAQHSNDTVEHHSYGCELKPSRSLNTRLRECDIDTREGRCFRWELSRSHHYCSPPTHADLHLCYFGPERAQVRDTLRGAARDYNAYGDTDIEPVNRQTRRSTFTGDYWD